MIATLQSLWPFVLGDTRFHGVPQRMSVSRVLADIERSAHTFAVDDLVVPDRLVAAASLVAGDLLSAFGLAESLQLTASGAVRRRYVDSQFGSLIGWATSNGVEVSEEEVR